MFRYTPPWQVLCNSLDHDFKRQSSIVTGNPYDARIHLSQKDQSVINSHHSQRRPSSRPAQDPLPPRAPMTSKPKLWVIKPLSPKLEPTDLRSILSPTGQPLSTENKWSNSQDSESLRFNFDSISITGMQPSVIVSTGGGESNPDVVVQARQVAVSEDESDSEDWRPSSPGTPSSTSSHAGFYSFVDDPASPEAEMNEAYMVSPERQAKLNTLTEKSSFKLQTYVEEKRPGRLFQETNGDALYRVEDASPLNEEVESPDRMEIIRNQAPKKSPALKKQWSALENLDLSNTPQRLLDGFSLCYSPVSSKAEQAKAEPGTIDNEQINFNVARKQFLMMEQSKQNPFLQSPHQAPYSPKLKGGTLSPMASIFTAKQLSKENSLKENQIPVKKQAAADIKTVTVTADPENGVQSGAIDDSDSGLGDRGGGYASDGSISNDPSILEMESFLVPSVRETPIEREIRIAQEREENLRRSRGILRTDNSEMVEIRTTKPILSQPSPQLKSLKSKETNRVSFLIQRELEHEKLRKAQNRTSSLYNEGDQGEKEKRKISDQVPITSLRTSPTESLINDLQQKAVTQEDAWISEQPVLVEEGDTTDSEEGLSPCCPHRHPDESFLQKHYNENSNIGNQDGNFSAYPEDNIQSKVKIFQVNSSQTSNPRAKKEASWIAENDASMSTRNRLSSSNIPSSMEPIKNNQYVPIYRSHLERRTWSPQVQNAPLSIRQEIEQDLRREQELQELRESSSQFFSTNRGVDVSEPKTSVEQKPQPTSSEETVSSLEIPKTDLVEVDSVFPEKQKTDYSYPYSWNLDTHISTADKSSQLSSPRLASRLPSVAMMTPMPWGNPKPMSPTVSRVTPIKPLSPHTDMSSPLSQKGLTETLLKDFEERRVKLKLEESAYAGIQPVDEINNEVVEATRVIRHKNQRALQWEAGMYANEESK